MYEMWIIICINRTHTVDIYDFMHIFMVKHAIFYRYIFGTHDQTLIGEYLLLLCPCPYAIWGTLECVTYHLRNFICSHIQMVSLNQGKWSSNKKMDPKITKKLMKYVSNP